MNYDIYTLEELLDALPQNRPLYRDSSLWQIRSDDMEETLFQQGIYENFRDFIIRALGIMKDNGVDITFWKLLS